MSLDIALRELAEVDIGLQFRVDGDGNLAVAQGQFDIELTLEQRSLQAQHVVVGHNLVHTILRRVEFRAFPHL